MKRRVSTLAAGGLALMLLLTACSGSPSDGTTGEGNTDAPIELTTLKVVRFPTVAFMPGLIGNGLGVAEKEGLRLEQVDFQTTSLVGPAMLSGEVQIGSCDLAQAANLAAQGKKILMFIPQIKRVTLDFMVTKKFYDEKSIDPASPVEERMNSLKGAKIGISAPGGTGDIWTNAILKKFGLMDDVEKIRTGSIANLRAALLSGQIDGYMGSPPHPGVATGDTAVLINNSDKGEVFDNYYYTNPCVTQEFAEKNPELVRAYAKVINAGLEVIHADLDRAAELALEGGATGSTVAELKNSLAQAQNSFAQPGTKFNADFIKLTLDVFKTEGAVPNDADPTEGVLWSNEYVVN